PLGEALAGADVDGYARPPPVVDVEAKGDERLGAALRVDALFRAVARRRFAFDPPGVVLGPHGLGADVERVEDLDGPQRLHLLVADALRVHRRRRLHEREG